VIHEIVAVQVAGEEQDRRESVAHMFSEFFRELAALIFVFVPLDYLLKDNHLGPHFWSETAGVALASGALLMIGIILERASK
jgi:hypothetical protein